MLVQHRGATDPETGGSYTIKRYQSEKQGDGEGWQHGCITLMPMSRDPQYQPLVLMPKDEEALRVGVSEVNPNVLRFDAVLGLKWV